MRARFSASEIPAVTAIGDALSLPARNVALHAGTAGRAASGHPAAEPTITLMKSRRRIALPKAGTTPIRM